MWPGRLLLLLLLLHPAVIPSRLSSSCHTVDLYSNFLFFFLLLLSPRRTHTYMYILQSADRKAGQPGHYGNSIPAHLIYLNFLLLLFYTSQRVSISFHPPVDTCVTSRKKIVKIFHFGRRRRILKGNQWGNCWCLRPLSEMHSWFFFYDPVQRNAQDPSTNYYEAPAFHLKENRNFLYINIYLYTYVFYPFPLRECSQTFSRPLQPDRKLLCTRGWFAR